VTERLSNVSGLEVGGVCACVLVCWCLLSKGLLQPLTPSLPQWLDIYSDFSEANGFAIYFLVLVDAAVTTCLVVLGLPFLSDTVQYVQRWLKVLRITWGITGDWHFL